MNNPVSEKHVTDKPRCRVLVVEDETMIAMLVEDMVQDFGCEAVGPAARLDEALNLAHSADLDAAILDINVGGADIFPVADVLRARGIPLIFSTGYGVDRLPPRFLDCPTLRKPFAHEAFREVLLNALADQPCHTEAA